MKMRKNLLVILTAGLLLLSVTACKKDPETPEDTDPDIDTAETTGSYVVIETDTDGNPVTTTDPETEAFDPSEKDPTFNEISMQVVVVSSVATVRTSTEVSDSNTNAVGWPKEGRQLTVTGESANWYRINYPVNGEEQACYIAKSVVGDIAVFDSFKAIEGGEEIEVTAVSLNVRSYPSADYDVAIRGTLAEGTKVTRVAANENWSRILYEVEVTVDGETTTETKEYYVSNAYIKVVGADETGTETGDVTETTAADTETSEPTGDAE